MTVGRPLTSFVNFCDKTLAYLHAAVDADGLAGHEVAVVGCEKDHRADEFRQVLIANRPLKPVV